MRKGTEKIKSNYDPILDCTFDTNMVNKWTFFEYPMEHGVFIKSIKSTTPLLAVYEALARFGKLVYLRMPFHRERGINIGSCYAFFDRKEVAQYMVQSVKSLEVHGKCLKILPHYVTKSRASNLRKVLAGTELPCRPQMECPERSQEVRLLAEVLKANPEKIQAPASTNSVIDKQFTFGKNLENLSLHIIKPTRIEYSLRSEFKGGKNHLGSNITYRIQILQEKI